MQRFRSDASGSAVGYAYCGVSCRLHGKGDERCRARVRECQGGQDGILAIPTCGVGVYKIFENLASCFTLSSSSCAPSSTQLYGELQ